MAREINRLNARRIAALVKEGKPGMYCDGDRLYLSIPKPGRGNPYWIFRYRVAGKAPRDFGIGPLATWSLAQARERARKYRQLRDDGRDPIDERKAVRQQKKLEAATSMTFRRCAESYFAANRDAWKSAKHVSQWLHSMAAYVYPGIGDLPVQSIDVALVMKIVEPIWKPKTETASRVRGRIESVLDWATARGYRQGENPARWRGHLENLLPKKTKVSRVEHFAALPYAKLGAFVADLRLQDGIVARALEFAILTAARTGEVIGARWSEIDLDARLWTIPGSRMKAGRDHRVPLSEPAVAVLRAMQSIKSGEYVFSIRSGRPIAENSMFKLLRRMGRDALTVHGFRSAFSDWCAEQTNFPSEVREMALAHTVGDKVEAAYRRSDLFEKRRQLMDAWSRYCATPSGSGEVVNLRAAS